MHTTLIAAISRLVALEVLRSLAPSSATVGTAHADAWADCRTVMGAHWHGGRVEAIVRDHASVRLAGVLAAFAAVPAANDSYTFDACAL